ncbi:MAG: D-alanine--D-alanine ligase [Planctomycetota bacterium]
MKVVVLFHEPGEDATVEDRDVLVQRDAVATATQRLGHQTSCLGCTLDLAAAKQRLLAAKPDIVFNLVESLGGTDRLMSLATMLLDALDIPYTGTRTKSILATSDKLTAKERMCEAGLPTPAWLDGSAKAMSVRDANYDVPWILKPILEHASFGMDDEAVVRADDLADLSAQLRDRERRIGRPLFAEQFIEGREFNLSLLNGRVLPAAEIDFSSFPADKPRIVGHQAKWDQDSFEYQQTPRCFEFPAADASLRERLAQLTLECWQLFDLSGYARVDFRVDGEGRPWILEVNVNPCLSPDAGFAAALAEAGITYDDAIGQIIESAVRGACEPTESSRLPFPTASEGHRTLTPRM